VGTIPTTTAAAPRNLNHVVNLRSVRRGAISVSLSGGASDHHLMELSQAVASTASSIFIDGAVGTVGGVTVPMDETTLLLGSIAFLSLVGLAVMANEDHDRYDNKKETVTKTASSSSSSSSSSSESSTTKATSKAVPTVASTADTVPIRSIGSQTLETTATLTIIINLVLDSGNRE
jgi:hypothetical protein